MPLIYYAKMKLLILRWQVAPYVRDGGITGRQRLIYFAIPFRLWNLGISAIDLDGSLLDYDYHEVQVKRAIIEKLSPNVIKGLTILNFLDKPLYRLGEL